jgi:hypothetical protein
MNAEEFTDAAYTVVYKTAVNGVLKQLAQPAGRRPRQELVELSRWFSDLPDADKSRVNEVVRLAADHAVFGFMSVLDGVRVIDDGGRTELYLRTGDGTLLSENHDLHELFRARADAEFEQK